MAETGIDDLPEALLLHILSFLPTMDAITFSSISRRWRNLWHHVPLLDFDMRDFNGLPKSLTKTRDFYADFITQTIFLRPLHTPIHAFRLVFDYRNTGHRQIEVESWIRHAIDAGVTILRLNFEVWVVSGTRGYRSESSDDDLPDEAFACYEFHFSLLRNNCSVRTLKLVNCDVVLPKTSEGELLGYEYTSLCSISFHGTNISDEQLFVLISSFVNLEYLSISGIEWLSNFKIYSKKLRELKMGYSPAAGSFEIDCPSLQKIRFRRFNVEDYRAKDLSCLVEARVEFSCSSEYDALCWWQLMKMLTGVERLITDNMCLDREDWIELLGTEDFTQTSAFKNVNNLELRTEYTKYGLVGISSFLEVCPALESLAIDYCFEVGDELSEEFMDEPFILLTPNLKQVKMRNFKGTKSELLLVESLKKHCVLLREIIAYPPIVNGHILPPLFL